MSMYVRISLQAMNTNYDRTDEIAEMVYEKYGLEHLYSSSSLYFDAQVSVGNLDSYMQCLAEDIWEENRGYCEITIEYIDLENLPYECVTFNEENFTEVQMKKNTWQPNVQEKKNEHQTEGRLACMCVT